MSQNSDFRFRVGDTVKVVANGSAKSGERGEVVKVDYDSGPWYQVKFSHGEPGFWCFGPSLALVEEAQADTSETDMVNSPPHYNQGSIETIDGIEVALGPGGFVAYCRGNALKYLWRAAYKGAEAEDLRKAEWYCRKAAEAAEAANED